MSQPHEMWKKWPCLTAEITPIAGAIKRRYEDFRVEEIPLYEACGEGDHVYITIEKTGLATMRAVNDIARALGVKPRDVGMAGLKDARGVTQQTLSVEHVDPARVEKLDVPRIKIVKVNRHRNKLRVGHLRGNRFVIRLREVDPARLKDAEQIMSTLHQRGVPNYFGAQRFGLRGDTAGIGRALIDGDFAAAASLIAGSPGPHDSGPVLKARQLFDQKQYEDAAKAWPYGFRECAHLCRQLAKKPDNAKRAVLSLEKRLLGFYSSAYQSLLFNNVLAVRLATLDQLMVGDLAERHDNGAVFRVEDLEAETPRAERFEISPTGPIFGHRMTEPTGRPAEIEEQALAEDKITRDQLPDRGPMRCTGGRRALRFQPTETALEVSSDSDGTFMEFRFTLPSGCYATSVLREICKDRLEEGLDD